MVGPNESEGDRMTSDDQDTREVLAEWARDVMARHRISAERWGRLAGTSPTNITRLLRPGEYSLTARTIAKLASVVNENPPIIHRKSVSEAALLPLLSGATLGKYAGLPQTERRDFLMSSTLPRIAAGRDDAGMIAVEVEGDGINVLPGDVVIVDPSVQPVEGLLMCVLHQQRAEVRRFSRGFFVGTKSALLRESEVLVLGQAKRVLRELK